MRIKNILKQGVRLSPKTNTKSISQQNKAGGKTPELETEKLLNGDIQIYDIPKKTRKERIKKNKKTIFTASILVINTILLLNVGYLIGFEKASPNNQIVFVTTITDNGSEPSAFYKLSQNTIYIKDNLEYYEMKTAFWHEYTHYLVDQNNNKTLIEEIKIAFGNPENIYRNYGKNNWEEGIATTIEIAQVSEHTNPFFTEEQKVLTRALLPRNQWSPNFLKHTTPGGLKK